MIQKQKVFLHLCVFIFNEFYELFRDVQVSQIIAKKLYNDINKSAYLQSNHNSMRLLNFDPLNVRKIFKMKKVDYS